MKQLLLILLFASLAGNLNVSFSWDSTAAKYYPLAVGNSWTYSGFGFPCCGGFKYREKITGTIVTNGHFYFILTVTQSTGSSVTSYIRLDSSKGIVCIYDVNGCPWLQNERAKDSLSARKGDSSRYSCENLFYHRCTDTMPGQVFGINKQKKSFSWTNYFEAGGGRTFARDFGLVATTLFGAMNNTYINLTGCYINGILYGDTTLTGINLISSEIPAQFSLSQNYPNPFNPVTNIKFQIPNPGFVNLIIYDVLGKEVQTLVSKQLSAGSYEADWDASSYPSGVYYYKLSAGDASTSTPQAGTALSTGFTETKKMVLIK